MDEKLTANEARVLGCLIEKEITTPEYYPLSLNALVNACNQKSNRDPVMTLDEEAVRQALRALSDRFYARSAGTEGRVAKFEHRLQEVFNFHRHEIALLCVLLLRGAQTPGELRTRTERMYTFDDLDSVVSALGILAKREPPLVAVLPRQPGSKEARYTELLSARDQSSQDSQSQVYDRSASPGDSGRLAALEAELLSLRQEVSKLREEVQTLRSATR